MVVLVCMSMAYAADVATPAQPATERVEVATADVDTLLKTLERLQLAEQAIMKQLSTLKAQAIEKRNEELSDAHSIALRGPSADIMFDGPSQGVDQYSIYFSDRMAEKLPADQEAVLRPQLEAAFRQADQALNACVKPGWPIVTLSFSLDSGKLTVAPELRELAPNSVENTEMANCFMEGVGAFSWPDFGHDVVTTIVWRNVAGF